MRSSWLVLLVAACGSSEPIQRPPVAAPAASPAPVVPVPAPVEAPLANHVVEPTIAHPPTLPCPLPLTDPFDHEVFPGCSAMPFAESLSVCPHGECPKPCRVRFEGRQCCPVEPTHETQVVTYDARGRWVSSIHAKGDESGSLLDARCTYDGDHLATCERFFEGKTTSKTTASRDRSGRITALSDPDMGSMSFTYDASGNVTSTSAGREYTEYRYNDHDQLVGWTEQYKRDTSTMTYRYNADGDVVEAREGMATTTYAYDARRRLVHVVTKYAQPDSQIKLHDEKLEYDDQDRLVRITKQDDHSETSLWIYTFQYDCR